MERVKLPIIGHYYLGQYVIVYGGKERDELKLLGYFGRDLEDIKKKEDSKRGPEDRRILDSIPTVDDETKIILSLHEAFFLKYALNCLDIKLNGTSSIDIDTCWFEFRKYHRESNIRIDFCVEFCVYFYFRTRGWVVKSGNNYGTNFLLYKGSPASDHSLYAIHIVHSTDSNLNWKTVLTHHRVIQSVGKELLFVYVDRVAGDQAKPSCIKDMRLQIRKVTCTL
jgi:tRNA-intron lyase